MNFWCWLTLLLAYLKLTNQTDVSWWVVWAPYAFSVIIKTIIDLAKRATEK